jgi:hypothetical protein
LLLLPYFFDGAVSCSPVFPSPSDRNAVGDRVIIGIEIRVDNSTSDFDTISGFALLGKPKVAIKFTEGFLFGKCVFQLLINEHLIIVRSLKCCAMITFFVYANGPSDCIDIFHGNIHSELRIVEVSRDDNNFVVEDPFKLSYC